MHKTQGASRTCRSRPSKFSPSWANDYVQQLAAKVGLSSDKAGSMLAGLLPLIVDKLTPNGQLPAASSSLLDGAMGLFKAKAE